ncbi:MAG: excision repair protein [Thermoproteota archaeon]|nr:excision repair protein [Thermoproteota archaeon]
MPFPERVIVDQRENASGIPELLKASGLRVEFRMLAVGDYIFPSGYAVERKEVHDFVNSLFTGRLMDQASRLTQCYENALLLVEGDANSIVDGLSNPRSFWGALAALTFNFHIRIFFTYTRRQTADFLYTLAKRKIRSEPEKPLIYNKTRTRSNEDLKLAILSSFPGIGPKLAQNMLSHFGSLREVFSASVSELVLVKGVGRVKAHQIVQLLESRQEICKETLEQTKLTKIVE